MEQSPPLYAFAEKDVRGLGNQLHLRTSAARQKQLPVLCADYRSIPRRKLIRPGVVAELARLDPEGQKRLAADLEAVFRANNSSTNGGTAHEAEYLEVHARRR